MKIKAGIIGATGYAGAELVRLLSAHLGIESIAVSSVSFEGKLLSEVYPSFYQLCDLRLVPQQQVLDSCDVVFGAVPHGLSEKLAVQCKQHGSLFIDLGADFRLESEQDYADWYGGSYSDKELHSSAVYGIPELFGDSVRQARLIANPGCYPTSTALGLAPVIAGLVDTDSIVIDAKSGVTGAGRGLTQNTHYPDCNENFAPYKVAEHRHTPEIEQTLSVLAGKPVMVTFVPHLLPINRGILSTIYSRLLDKVSCTELWALYSDYYKNSKFVRVLPEGSIASIRSVKYSNYCDISLHVDKRTDRLIVVSAIDNMVKGAAGQAIQNMNLAMGLDEDTGLCLVPPCF